MILGQWTFRAYSIDECQIFWSNMREHILPRSHLPAQHAKRHLHHQMVCYELLRPLGCSKFDKSFKIKCFEARWENRYWWEIIQLLSMRQDIYIIKWFMAFQMSLVCGWKNDTWLMAFSISFFRAYSINEYNISQFMTFQMVVMCGRNSATYLLNVALFHPHVWSITREHTLLRSHLYLLSMGQDIYTFKWFVMS